MEAQKWTWQEYDLIRKKFPDIGTELLSELPGRSIDTLLQKAGRLEVNTDCPFTDEEKALADKYGMTLGTALVFVMPSRTPYEVARLLNGRI